jgi:hypothetical protein
MSMSRDPCRGAPRNDPSLATAGLSGLQCGDGARERRKLRSGCCRSTTAQLGRRRVRAGSAAFRQVGGVPPCPRVTVNRPGSPSDRARNGHAVRSVRERPVVAGL